MGEAGGEEQEGRRRGRRGGRGRRGEGRPESSTAVAEQTVSEIVAEAGGAPEPQPQAVTAAAVAKAEPVAQPATVTETPRPEPLAAPEPIQVARPAPSKLPEPDLGAAGLQMVETAAPSVKAAESVGEATPPRRRRARAQSAETTAPADGLVMVETKAADAAPAPGEAPSEWGPPSNPRRRARPKAEEQAPAEPLVLVETKASSGNETTPA